MLRVSSYDIVFQEVPGEITLALNLTNCPNRCPGCHSPHLWPDSGEVLDEASLTHLLRTYGAAITCVCFMGGDASPQEVARLAAFIHQHPDYHLKTAWYSGKPALPEGCSLHLFNYIKLGPYLPALGGLDSPTTNQRFYRIECGEMTDFTHLFRKKKLEIE